MYRYINVKIVQNNYKNNNYQCHVEYVIIDLIYVLIVII